MQRLARDHVRRVLQEQEKMNYELETKKKELDGRSKELNKREALTEREKQKLDEDMKKVAYVMILEINLAFYYSFNNVHYMLFDANFFIFYFLFLPFNWFINSNTSSFL